MNRPGVSYGPPMTDSEDEDYGYDGFCFGDELKKPTGIRWTTEYIHENSIYDSLVVGNLEQFKQQVELDKNFNVDEYMDGSYTPLLHACKLGHVAIVEYLLDKRASPNKHYDSYTPLMLACDTDLPKKKEPRIAEKLVHLLLKHNAEINLADKYGVTAFMLACQNGYTDAVRLMLKNVSFDNVDNMGRTPIFYAIENNHADIVKLLVEAGADTSIPNCKGFTPKQIAQFHGFYDLLELLPKQQESYTVPSSFLSYGTLRDTIPRLFLKSDCPEYFQEINSILMAFRLEKLLEYFAKEHIPLSEFLCMNDERLKKIGIEFPIYCMKLQKHLLDFHLNNWKATCIAKLNKSPKENFYEILKVAANHLQNIVILKSSLRYIRENMENNKLGTISTEDLEMTESILKSYQRSLLQLRDTAKYLSTFSPRQNPLYIDYDEDLKERKRNKIKRFFKYTTLIVGVSIFICLKIRIF